MSQLIYDSNSNIFTQCVSTCVFVTSILVIGAPLWSLITLTVIPVVGLLTAIKPSLPPDIIIRPDKWKKMFMES